MHRPKWIAGGLTVALLCTGLLLLRNTSGADGDPGTPAKAPAEGFPSRALGLSGHRRLVEQLEDGRSEHSGHGPAHSPRKGASRAGSVPLAAARPLRLRIPDLGVDVPLSAGSAGNAVGWDVDSPTPGAAGTAVVSGESATLRLATLRKGRTIEIPRADGRTAVFTIDHVGTPRALGTGKGAELRVVTGETTVHAHLTGTRRTR
ncbi:class F sortase [Streptomyces sp. G-G2]|uniref:class F sortase n=1 Tax=Streptomyces sp. G-G2 TaxID=3046201 RepID=UPI0024BAB52A|nr:class F sortase [Streptomyces sp. G-G2]MDJ0380692.1 class F sortase [Streptomyces sp. G-G2]